MASVSSISHVTNSVVLLWPDGLHWDAYQQVFRNNLVPTAYANTIFITLMGTVISMLLTCASAFVLSRKELPGRRLMTLFVVPCIYDTLNKKELRSVREEDLKLLGQKVEEDLRSRGLAEVTSDEVGKAILKPLRDLDVVAYLRFASVYQNFAGLEDFQSAIDGLRE